MRDLACRWVRPGVVGSVWNLLLDRDWHLQGSGVRLCLHNALKLYHEALRNMKEVAVPFPAACQVPGNQLRAKHLGLSRSA